MSKVIQQHDGHYKIPARIPIEIKVIDILYAIAIAPASQGRKSILFRASKFYDGITGKEFPTVYWEQKDLKVYVSIMSSKFPEIPTSYVHEVIEEYGLNVNKENT